MALMRCLDDIEKAVPELGKAGGFSVTSLEGYRQEPDTIDLSLISGARMRRFASTFSAP